MTVPTVRAYAAQHHGFTGSRGRLPRAVLDAYEAAYPGMGVVQGRVLPDTPASMVVSYVPTGAPRGRPKGTHTMAMQQAKGVPTTMATAIDTPTHTMAIPAHAHSAHGMHDVISAGINDVPIKNTLAYKPDYKTLDDNALMTILHGRPISWVNSISGAIEDDIVRKARGIKDGVLDFIGMNGFRSIRINAMI